VSPHRRSPRALGLAIEDLQNRVAPATVLAAIQGVWTEAVGATIAAAAAPTAERGGVLTVSCSAAVWAHELDLMSLDILERLNQLVPGATVQRLRCVTAEV
jgi:predicted nucleic acid-binding Zn ribbon protein